MDSMETQVVMESGDAGLAASAPLFFYMRSIGLHASSTSASARALTVVACGFVALL